MKYLTYKHLQEELKQAKLPYSRTYLQILENGGVISKPANSVMFRKQTIGFSTDEIRIFTMEEIMATVEKVKKYNASIKTK